MPVIQLAPSRLLSISDGDTPEVKMGIRMLGIDTPELHFPLGSDPVSQDPVLEGLPKTAAWQKLPKALQDYLTPRLIKAGTRQKAWGLKAKAAFQAMVTEGLAMPRGVLQLSSRGLPQGASGTGSHGEIPGEGPSGGRPRNDKKEKRRQLFMACGPEVFDRYGRILAYVGPLVPKAERGNSAPPDTFNLRLLAEGWAAPCVHRANLPKPKDRDLMIAAVQNARKRKLGFWADAGLVLHGYEFRSLCRLAAGEPGFTYSITDARTLKNAKPTTYAPTDYIAIPEEYRVFE